MRKNKELKYAKNTCNISMRGGSYTVVLLCFRVYV